MLGFIDIDVVHHRGQRLLILADHLRALIAQPFALAGDKVTQSTMTVNGFNLNCVDFNAGGALGTSTICSTEQGILGYVKVASDSTSFEIQSYSTSPPASLFELPPGATVTTTPTTPTGSS